MRKFIVLLVIILFQGITYSDSCDRLLTTPSSIEREFFSNDNVFVAEVKILSHQRIDNSIKNNNQKVRILTNLEIIENIKGNIESGNFESLTSPLQENQLIKLVNSLVGETVILFSKDISVLGNCSRNGYYFQKGLTRKSFIEDHKETGLLTSKEMVTNLSNVISLLENHINEKANIDTEYESHPAYIYDTLHNIASNKKRRGSLSQKNKYYMIYLLRYFDFSGMEGLKTYKETYSTYDSK